MGEVWRNILVKKRTKKKKKKELESLFSFYESRKCQGHIHATG